MKKLSIKLSVTSIFVVVLFGLALQDVFPAARTSGSGVKRGASDAGLPVGGAGAGGGGGAGGDDGDDRGDKRGRKQDKKEEKEREKKDPEEKKEEKDGKRGEAKEEAKIVDLEAHLGIDLNIISQ